MNRLKLILFIVAGLAAVLLFTIILAFTPGVQTWAVRRSLAGQPGIKVEIGRVAAGLSSADLSDVRIEQDGTVIVAKEINANYSASDYLFGRRITVERLVARGVEVDASKPKSSEKSAAASPAKAALAPFAGILGAVRLPGEIRVGSIDVSATVRLPDNQSATLALQGGGIAPGEFATIKWTATFADPRKGAALATAQAAGEVKLRTTKDLRIDALEVTGDAGATGPALPADRVKLELKLAQTAANAGETIVARVSLVRGSAVEPLFNADVAYAAGKPILNGTWKLSVRSEQFAAVLAGFGLPEVALAGGGDFSFNVDSGAGTASGALDGKIAKLEKLGAELGGIGALQVHAAFEGGGSKESAQLGKLEFNVAADDGRKLVAVVAQQKLSFSFKDQRVTPERPGAELARVSLLGVPLAWAQPWVKPRVISAGDVSGVFVVDAELDGSRVKARAVEPLAIRGATVRDGAKVLVDRATLSISPSVDYTAKRIVVDAQKLSISTPDGDTVTGVLSADIVTGGTMATTFSVELQGRLAALVKPYLPADAGPLTLAVSAKGRHEGQSLQLAALKVQVDREGGGVLAAVEALQPLSVDLGGLKVGASNATAPVARVRWGEIPLAWAEPYVAQSKLSGQLAAGVMQVTLPGADAVKIRADGKISARGATVALDGREWLRAADVATDLDATWKAGTLTADVHQLEVRQGDTSLLTAAFAGEVTPAKTPVEALRASGHGSIAVEFGALAKQPALAAQLPLLRGSVSAKFDGAAGDGTRGKLELVGKNLVAREGAQPLGTMELSVEVNLDANNSGTVRVPLVVTKDGRRSDLLLDGKVGLKPGAVSFEGRVASTALVVDDLQAFSALGATPAPTVTTVVATPSPQPRAAPAATPTPVRDTTPVWAGFAGRIDLDLKSVKQGAGNTVQNIHGALAARPDRLTIENISGQLNGNPFKVATVLGFDAKQNRPYTLVGSVEVPGFDVGEFLRKADPSAPPAVETKVTVNSKFNGTAANLAEFADRLTGQFEFKGSKGILRALNKKAETTSTVSSALGLIAGLAGQQKIADSLSSASELASMLKDIPFDGITIQVERGADAAIVVKSIDVLSPSLHLTGSGRIDHKPGTDFAASPLTLDLQLAAKNELANGLNKARQLNGKTDSQGYYLMATPFTLRGTLSKTDSSDFWRNLTLNTGASFLR